MTDKEEIKFAIRYLKQGLKSKRTPPLYEELMNELGFVKEVKSESCCQRCALPNDLVGSAWCTQHCQHDNRFKRNKEFAELKAYNEKLLDGDIEKHNKIVELQKENAELKEELKDANEKVVHLACNQNKDLKYKLTKAKEIIKRLLKATYGEGWNYSLQVKVEAEKFLKELE